MAELSTGRHGGQTTPRHEIPATYRQDRCGPVTENHASSLSVPDRSDDPDSVAMLTAYRRLLEMMTRRERKRFWLLVAITFVLSLFEVGSVVSILPFLRLLAEPGLIDTVPALAWAYKTGGFTTTQNFLIWAGVAVFLVTVFGLILKLVTIWLMIRFALMRSYSLSARLLGNYLHQPYEWFLTRHSADMGNAILAEVDQIVGQALLPAMRIIPEVFTVLLLIGALCLLEPEIALGGAALLGGVYGLIFIGVRRLLVQLGHERFSANQSRFHVVQEATGGAKELKIMGLESRFLKRFRDAAHRMAHAQTRVQVIADTPRQAVEAIAFGGMISLILVLIIRGDGDIAALVPTLGLIAFAGLRLIPALQQIYSRGATLRQSEAPLARIHEDLTTLTIAPNDVRHRRDTRPPLHLTRRLEMSGIGYDYPGTTRQAALSNLDMVIEADNTIGIVGGTGAGKTTLVDIILGLLDPLEGTLSIDGEPITSETRRAWQKTLGYVPQTIFLSDGSVAENIAFGLPRDEIDMEAVERAARIAALHDFVLSELPDGYNTMVGERGTRLSGGQRQRIGIARALYHDPSTLIFDEATSALDTLTETAVMEAVLAIAGTKTILMIAHRLTTVRDCDMIFLMREGRVVASGRFEELIDRDDEFRKMAADLTTERNSPG